METQKDSPQDLTQSSLSVEPTKKIDKRAVSSRVNAIKAQEGRKKKALEQRMLIEKYKTIIPDSDSSDTDNSDEEIIYVGPKTRVLQPIDIPDSVPEEKHEEYVQTKQKFDTMKEKSKDRKETEKLKKELDDLKQLMMLMTKANSRKRSKKIIVEREVEKLPSPELVKEPEQKQPIVARTPVKDPHKDMLAKKILNF